MSEDGPKTWILTGSLENFRINVERGFDVIGFTPIWPQGKSSTAAAKAAAGSPEPYPWRVEAEPVLVLPEADFVPAEELVTELEHVRKWPLDHWHLAFQGQLRTIGEADATLLRERLSSKVAAGA